MADTHELFDGAALAIATQSAFGTVDAGVKALSGALVNSDGIILGDRESGENDTGIVIPNFSSIVRELPIIAGSFTEQAAEFIREAVDGLAITFPLKGNGADAGAPDAGVAQPFAGIDELLGCAGLVGANGAAAPDYKYTPRGSIEYASIHLWLGDLDFILQDCVVDTLSLAFDPGAVALATATFKVGKVESWNDGVTFPTFTWGSQSSLASPVVEGVAFAAFGQTRGFENLVITISNEIADHKDSNVADTGIRHSQSVRPITVDGKLYVEAGDSAAEHTALVATSAPTADLSFQVGDPDVGGAETELNAYLVNVNNLHARDIKYGREGTSLAVELTGARATGTAGGDEFMLEYN